MWWGPPSHALRACARVVEGSYRRRDYGRNGGHGPWAPEAWPPPFDVQTPLPSGVPPAIMCRFKCPGRVVNDSARARAVRCPRICSMEESVADAGTGGAQGSGPVRVARVVMLSTVTDKNNHLYRL